MLRNFAAVFLMGGALFSAYFINDVVVDRLIVHSVEDARSEEPGEDSLAEQGAAEAPRDAKPAQAAAQPKPLSAPRESKTAASPPAAAPHQAPPAPSALPAAAAPPPANIPPEPPADKTHEQANTPSPAKPAPPPPWPFVCQTQVIAYDPVNPVDPIGYFLPGTEVQLCDDKKVTGMLLVGYSDPDGKKIEARCMAKDLFADPGKVKNTSTERTLELKPLTFPKYKWITPNKDSGFKSMGSDSKEEK